MITSSDFLKFLIIFGVPYGGGSGATDLAGDVTGEFLSNTVLTVGGATAASIATTVDTVADATALSTPLTLALRDVSGGLSATNFSGAGTGLTGTAPSLTAGTSTAVAVSIVPIPSTYYPLMAAANGTSQRAYIAAINYYFDSTTSTLNLGGSLILNALTENTIIFSNSSKSLTSIASVNNATLITSGAGVPSLSATLPNAVQSNITRLGTIATATTISQSSGSSFSALTLNNPGVGGIVFSVLSGPGGVSLTVPGSSGRAIFGISGATTGYTFSGVLRFSSYTTAGTLVNDASGDITSVATLPVVRGGTGQTTYTNGQLLIGNTTGNTLAKATLTQGAGITITNGAGSITVANAGVLSITGTANQIIASAATGSVTLSLPQNIAVNSTPTFQKLYSQVSSSATGSIKLVNSNNAGGDRWWVGFSHGTDPADTNDRARIGVDIASGGPGRLFFQTGSAGALINSMFIDQNGNVGVNTLSPTNTLFVQGTGRFTDTLYFNNSLESNAGNILLYTSGPSGFIRTTYIGFGNASSWDTNILLQSPNVVTAQARCPGWNIYSGKMFKHNIKEIDVFECLNIVNKIPSVSFWWNEGQGDNVSGQVPREQFGYIAEDVAEVLPTAVLFDSDGNATSVDYGRVSAIHSGAIQALHKQNLELIKKLEEQEIRILNLESLAIV